LTWFPAWWRRPEIRRLGGMALLAAIVVYAYPLTNFSLHIDDELRVSGSHASDVTIGRWGTALLHNSVLQTPFVAFFTPFLTILLLCAAAMAASSTLRAGDWRRLLFAVLYVAFPQFAYQLDFPSQSDCVAAGILCATLAALVLPAKEVAAVKNAIAALPVWPDPNSVQVVNNIMVVRLGK
jgi:hypothetical protein